MAEVDVPGHAESWYVCPVDANSMPLSIVALSFINRACLASGYR